MTEERATLIRSADGYRLTFDEIGVVLEGRHLRLERGALYAMVSVRTNMKGVRTVMGVVTEARLNLSSIRGRKDIAGACRERAPNVDLDWEGLLEEFSLRVAAAEREGQPFTKVGRLAARLDPGHTIAPLFPTGRPAFIYGPPAATKGFLAVAFCLSVETGVEIIPGLIPKPGRALYLDWESDQWDIDERVKKVARGAGIQGRPQIGYRECAGPIGDQIVDIIREVEKTGVTFIVIDSVGMAVSVGHEGGDANESTIRLFQSLRPLLTKGVTAVLIDHVTGAELGSRARSTKPYGSVFKLALARNTYEVRPLAQAPGDEHVRHVVVRHRKANSSAYLADMGFSLTFEPGLVRFAREEVRSAEEDADAEIDPETGWPTSIRVRVRRALEGGHRSVEELAEAIGEDATSVRRVLNRYSPKAAKQENRWFSRLPSGRYEALPVAPGVVARAEAQPVAPRQTTLDEPADGTEIEGFDEALDAPG